MRLHEALADREAEPGASGGADALPEEVRELVGRDPPALVRDRERDGAALVRRLDPDRGRGRRVAGRVREEVVQHLHDAVAVGHRPRQVRREVDEDGVPAAAAQEGGPGPVDQRGDVRRLGRDRERARLDAPRVQEVRDQAAHVVGLPVDDAEELEQLGLGRDRHGAQHRRRRALDRGQGGAELVAHHAEEFRPLPLECLERRQVLQGDDDRDDRSALRTDGRDVEERPDAPPVGHRQLDLLGPHRRGSLELPGQGQPFEGERPPVRVPARDHLEQLLRWAARGTEPLDEAPRLPVERHRLAGSGVEHHDADRRGLDERREVGPRPLDVAVRARVRDRRRRLRGEQHQDLLVLTRERLAVLLVAEKEVAEMLAPIAHRGPLQRLRAPGVRGEAARSKIAGQVRHPEWRRLVPQVCEESRPVGPLHHLPARLGRQAGGDEVLDRAPLVERRDHAGAGAGQRAGALDDLLQHGGQLEALADAEHRRAQPGDARIGAPGRVSAVQCSHSRRRGARSRPKAPGWVLPRRRGEWRIARVGRKVTHGT